MLKESIKNVISILKIPVIIFHEDFTKDIENDVLTIYPNIEFDKIDMIRHLFINHAKHLVIMNHVIG